MRGYVRSASDNAAMESFAVRLQATVLARHRWVTRDDRCVAANTSIEYTYHRRRQQAALGRLTPIGYEIPATEVAT